MKSRTFGRNPEPWYDQKDAVENYLYFEVCTGRTPLPEAQAEIVEDWRALYPPP